ncbi:MAG: LCP family protein [Caldiserica bacterium]|nr:LCP family protein [Caldisericota bacterium]
MAVQKHTLHVILALLAITALLAGIAAVSRALPTYSVVTDDPANPSASGTADHPVPAQRVVPPIPLQPQPDLDKPLNILLLGADSREKDDPGRADTIMLVRLDPATKHVRLLSFPRDTRVTIPGHGVNKLNQASSGYYRGGGTSLLVDTITTDLLPGLRIDYIVKTDFAGFAAIIDALGGVTIDVEERMFYKGVDVLIDLQPGIQHLDGEQALEYARFRMDAIGDFGTWSGEDHGRVARQKKLLAAVIDQTKEVRTLLRLPAIIRAVQAAVTTDMSFNVMARIAMTYKDVGETDVESVPFPGLPEDVDGISYVIPSTNLLRTTTGPLFGVAVPSGPSAD